MRIDDLLRRVKEAGGNLIPLGNGRLKVEAPEPLPADLRQALREAKAEILEVLNQSKSSQREPLGKVGRWGKPCPVCGDEWQWPTTNGMWICSWCYVGGVITEGVPA